MKGVKIKMKRNRPKEIIEPFIMNTDSEAAIYRTDICGWVARNGRFYGTEEESARWDGCTHVACQECGKPTEKFYTHCASCRKVRDIARYTARESKVWDGKAMLYSEALDKYFDDISQAEDELKRGMTLEYLRLVICEPVYLHQIDVDHWADDLPDDGELPEYIQKALCLFNMEILAEGPVSWEPGKFAVDLGNYDNENEDPEYVWKGFPKQRRG